MATPKVTSKINAMIRIVQRNLGKFVITTRSRPRGTNVPNFFNQFTSGNREENPTNRGAKRGESESQSTLTLEPMSDNSQNWSKNHATADSDCETLAQKQLPIHLAFCDKHGGDHEENTGDFPIVLRPLARKSRLRSYEPED